jgi:hypothetical protein
LEKILKLARRHSNTPHTVAPPPPQKEIYTPPEFNAKKFAAFWTIK